MATPGLRDGFYEILANRTSPPLWAKAVSSSGVTRYGRRLATTLGEIGPIDLLVTGAVAGGLFVWTFAEYGLHRFVFHFRPRNAWQERLSFLFHGVHHAQPMSKTRLVMPPAVSIPLALLFYGGFYVLLAVLLGVAHCVAPLFSGFIAGYLIYDMLHYSTHHFRLRWRFWQFLRRHHMLHHAQTPDLRYGVSSPLWDIVLGTMPS